MNYTHYILLFTFFAFSTLVSAQDKTLDSSSLRKIEDYNEKSSLKEFLKRGDYYLSDDYVSRGRRYIYMQQTYRNIKVNNHISVVLFMGDKVAHLNNKFLKLNPELKQASAYITAEDAVTTAAAHVKLPAVQLSQRSSQFNTDNREVKVVFQDSNISDEVIKSSLVWQINGNAPLLCWKVEIYTKDYQHYWEVLVNAETREIVEVNDLVINCSFDHENNSATHDCSAHHLHEEETKSLPASVASYRVFDMPVESPTHGARSLVVDPWLRAGGGNQAISLQWHDDGSNNYTTTRGNNVYAYEDQNNANQPGNSPNNAGLQFDYSYDQFATPVTNLDAAITNLFFWNNIIHDVFYQYGFDEPSGNFQQDNLGRGGLGSDYVRAEALDGSGTNNANFFTPSDGNRPRMQMYEWSTVSSPPDFEVNSPAGIAGFYDALESAFSNNNKLINVGPVTGDLVLVDDNNGTVTDGCQAFQNAAAINGNIAILDRGNCNFTVKALNAQNAGAVAVVIVNNLPGQGAQPMGGNNNSITVPTVSISYEDGQLIKNEMLVNTVNITLTGNPTYTPDSDLDNGIIIHEYGHGISIRLTGGPGTSCLAGDEQMGEGWSDYFGLMLTTDWATAQGGDRRGIGTFVQGQNPSGVGIRPFPYSTDLVTNPTTYDDIKSNSFSVPHGVGSVWCEMLWEMTWALVDDKGYTTDVYDASSTAGNAVALNLVVEGLKLQGCNPGFIDGRDAILEADRLLYNSEHTCVIWEAFAKRGLGADAEQGNSSSRSDGTEDFSIPNGVSIEKTALSDTVRERDQITYNFVVKSSCSARSNIVIRDTLPIGLSYVAGSGGNHANGIVTFGPFSLSILDSAEFSFMAEADYGIHFTPTVYIIDDVESGNTNWTISRNKPTSGSPSANWATSTAQSKSPTNSWFAPDNDFETDLYLTSNSMDFSGQTEILMNFWHYYDTETGWDGGVVEISTNGGTNWTDLENNFTKNGYNQQLANNPASSLSGRNAFSGNSNGFINSIIDLGGYAGQSNVRVRFRFAADGFVGGDGWYIDDIDISSTPSVTNVGAVTIVDTVFGRSSVFSTVGCAPPFNELDNLTPGRYPATKECTDDLGWTHYIYEGNATPTDDRLLLSIKKNGQQIGTIGDGIFEVYVVLEPDFGQNSGIDLSPADYVDEVGADNWYVSNRWWDVIPNGGGTNGQITAPVNVRFYFNETDTRDVNGSLLGGGYDTLIAPEAFSLYKVEDQVPSPTLAVHQNLDLGVDFLHIQNGANPTQNTWSVSPLAEVQFSVAGGSTIAEFEVGTFSGGGLGAFGFGQAQPVELASFDVSTNGCENSINWETVSELNCASFELQHSIDGRTFETIYKTNCEVSSTQNKSYNWVDKEAISGENYYRLLQTDIDGTRHFSKTIASKNDCLQADLLVSPNPVSDILRLKLMTDISDIPSGRLEIFDALGNAYVSQNWLNGQQVENIDLSALPAGTYVLRLMLGNGTMFIERFVKR